MLTLTLAAIAMLPQSASDFHLRVNKIDYALPVAGLNAIRDYYDGESLGQREVRKALLDTFSRLNLEKVGIRTSNDWLAVDIRPKKAFTGMCEVYVDLTGLNLYDGGKLIYYISTDAAWGKWKAEVKWVTQAKDKRGRIRQEKTGQWIAGPKHSHQAEASIRGSSKYWGAVLEEDLERSSLISTNPSTTSMSFQNFLYIQIHNESRIPGKFRIAMTSLPKGY